PGGAADADSGGISMVVSPQTARTVASDFSSRNYPGRLAGIFAHDHGRNAGGQTHGILFELWTAGAPAQAEQCPDAHHPQHLDRIPGVSSSYGCRRMA